MSKRWWLLAVAVLLLVEGPVVHADEGEAGRYDVLIERNIFSPARGERSQPAPQQDDRPQPAPRPAPPHDPGQAMVLRGFAVRGEQAVAMIEGPAEAMRRVSEGDVVAGRRITTIAIDRLTFEHDGELRTITLGMTLAGEMAPRPARSLDGTRSASERDNAGGSSAGSRNAVLERMRRRRQQIVGESPAVEAEREAREVPRERRDAWPSESPADVEAADVVENTGVGGELDAGDTGEMDDERDDDGRHRNDNDHDVGDRDEEAPSPDEHEVDDEDNDA